MADPVQDEDGGSPIIHEKTASQRSVPNPLLRLSLQPRQEIDSRVVIRLISLAADVHGRIIDISLGGCRIHTDRPFPVGVFRRVEVEFRIEGLPFRFGGVTQAIYDPCSVGVRFLDLSERKREQLQQLLEEIREQEPSPTHEE